MSKWILCKEKMPEPGMTVLVTIWGSDCIYLHEGETITEAAERVKRDVRYTTVATYQKDSDRFGNEWMDWFGPDGWPMVVKPVAWTFLPEPYQGEGHETD